MLGLRYYLEDHFPAYVRPILHSDEMLTHSSTGKVQRRFQQLAVSVSNLAWTEGLVVEEY